MQITSKLSTNPLLDTKQNRLHILIIRTINAWVSQNTEITTPTSNIRSAQIAKSNHNPNPNQ